MTKPLTERELIQLQIQAYEFYASLIDRAVGVADHQAKLPRWDEGRAEEYREIVEQLKQRLAELEKSDPEALSGPVTSPIPLP
jgi:hypothetical protein